MQSIIYRIDIGQKNIREYNYWLLNLITKLKMINEKVIAFKGIKFTSFVKKN